MRLRLRGDPCLGMRTTQNHLRPTSLPQTQPGGPHFPGCPHLPQQARSGAGRPPLPVPSACGLQAQAQGLGQPSSFPFWPPRSGSPGKAAGQDQATGEPGRSRFHLICKCWPLAALRRVRGRIYRWRMEGGARQRQGAGDGGSTQQLAEPGPGPLAPGSPGSAFLFQAGCSSVREFSASRGNSDRKGWSAWLPGPFRSPVGSPPVPGEGCPPGRGAPSCPQNQRSPPPSQLGCSPILSHRNDSVSKAWE